MQALLNYVATGFTKAKQAVWGSSLHCRKKKKNFRHLLGHCH